MEYKQFELVREVHGVAIRWHVYDQTGRRLTTLGHRTKTAAKRFVDSHNMSRLGRMAA